MLPGTRQLCPVIGMDREERLALAHPIPDLGPKHDSDSVVDLVALLGASATQQHGGEPDLAGIEPGYIPRARGWQFAHELGPGEARRIVDVARITVLCRDPLAELCQGLSGMQERLNLFYSLRFMVGPSGHEKHLAGHRQTVLTEIVGTLAVKGVQRLSQLKGIAYGVPEGLVHVGYDRPHFAPHPSSDVHHQ